jgi:hypothetical protein
MGLDFHKNEKVLVSSRKFIERRSGTRYKMFDGVFTVLKPRVQYSKLGSVIDISMRGMAFQYFMTKNIIDISPNELDIYISGIGLFQEDIPIKVTSAIKVPRIIKWPSTYIKRFGVQFLELPPNNSN